MTILKRVLPLGVLLIAAACSSGSNPGGAGSTPRVFFAEPADGATVKSPAHLKFGSQNFQIMAVPAGDVTSSRPGMGH
jgi:hypothetical protein